MATENKILMKEAREALAGNWGMVILAFVLVWVISSAISIFGIIIAGPLNLGMAIFPLSISRKKQAELSQVFDGFKKFGKSLVAYLLMILYILLWSLLLIIPGIVAALAYSQTFFILAEDDKISGAEALKKSAKLMKGYKWKYFKLELRFLGWFLLSILTLGIGLLWLVPYMQISYAKFYDNIK